MILSIDRTEAVRITAIAHKPLPDWHQIVYLGSRETEHLVPGIYLSSWGHLLYARGPEDLWLYAAGDNNCLHNVTEFVQRRDPGSLVAVRAGICDACHRLVVWEADQ